MARKKNDATGRRSRVIWTEAEKAKMVARAVDIQCEHPDLAGLPLLKATMRTSLPDSRWRKLIAVTQAPWFEPAVIAEIRRRTAEARADSDLIPILKGNADAVAGVAQGQDRFMAYHESWRTEQIHIMLEQSAIWIAILGELRTLNQNLGQTVPVQAPCECSTSKPISGRKPDRN